MAKKDKDTEELSIADVMKEINKKYGERSLFHLSSSAEVTAIPTNSLTLNYCSGIGGFAVGFMHMIYGPSGASKTTTALSVVANAQKMGYNCLYVDAENRFDMDRAIQIGVNPDELLLSQNNICEEVFDLIEDVLKLGNVQLVVLDSLATLITKDEYENDMEKQEMGTKAKLIGKGLRKINGVISELKRTKGYSPTILLTNQIRKSIGMFAPPEVVPGGEAPKFFCSQIVRLQAKHILTASGGEQSFGSTKADQELIGIRVAHKHVKNSFAPPHKAGEYNILWDNRVIDTLDESICLGLQLNIIEQLNARTYQFEDEKLTSSSNMRMFFETSEKNSERLKQLINECMKNNKNAIKSTPELVELQTGDIVSTKAVTDVELI